MNRPSRSLAVVSASLPARCVVCDGTGRVGWRHPACGPAKKTDCPHCAVSRPIPIYVYPPYRGDLPKGAA